MTTTTAEKLTPAQTALLDRITLDGPVYGVAVPKDADEASLNTARALVRKGLLLEFQDGGRAAPKFDLADAGGTIDEIVDGGPVPHPREMAEAKPDSKLSKGLLTLAKKLRSRKSRVKTLAQPTLAPHYVDPNRRAQMTKAKARRRAKNKVAAKSRRVNRLRSR